MAGTFPGSEDEMFQMRPGYVPDEPFFQAISNAPRDRKGRYFFKRSMGGMLAFSVIWTVMLLVGMIASLIMSGMFGLFDVLLITMLLASIVMSVVSFVKQRRKIVMDQEGITFVTGSKKSRVAYRDIMAVSALMPFRMQAQNVPVFEELAESQPASRKPPVVSFALYLRDQSGQEHLFPIIGQGFADRFDLLISKLDGMGFDGEFEKIYGLYLSHRVDLRTRTILPPGGCYAAQDPFRL